MRKNLGIIIIFVMTFVVLFLNNCAIQKPLPFPPEVNHAPIADAGSDQKVYVGTSVILNGAASSDPDGDRLVYGWVQTAGPSVTLSDASNVKPEFTPREVGVYTFQLIVNDGRLYSAPHYVTITAIPKNRPPIANAGRDQRIYVNKRVTLDGSQSYDPDRDSISYTWTQTGGPSVNLSDSTASRPTFTPRQPGIYNFQLVVNDGRVNSAPGFVTITAIKLDRPPVANAGSNQSVNVNALVTLDGSASYDPDKDHLTYRWTQTGGPSVDLSDPTFSQPSFSPSIVGTYTYEFKLVVNDGEIDSAPDYVSITAIPKNRRPIANAGSDQTIYVGTSVILNGAASSDPDGDRLVYGWVQTAGPSVTLSDASNVKPEFTPREAGVYTFQLIVNDRRLYSAPGYVTITAIRVPPKNRRPIANAGRDQRVYVNKRVTLDGSASYDPDKDHLTYRWSQPGGPSVNLSDSTASRPTFTPRQPATYTFQLIVNDGKRDSKPDCINIAVKRLDVCHTKRLGKFIQDGYTGTKKEIRGSMKIDQCKGYEIYVQTFGELEVCIPAGYELRGDINPDHFFGLKKFGDDLRQYMGYLRDEIPPNTRIRVEIWKRIESDSDFKFRFHLYPPGRSPLRRLRK